MKKNFSTYPQKAAEYLKSTLYNRRSDIYIGVLFTEFYRGKIDRIKVL